MSKILITGATGNVGIEVIEALQNVDHQFDLYAGVRNINKDKQKLDKYNVKLTPFDFTDCTTFKPALAGCDVLYLLRPPQIADVDKYFKPLIEACKEEGVKHIVFLSVQGVENNKAIPHHKIEQLITSSKIPYTFLRPAYFMQNFTTTLHDDLVNKKRIYLPAGNAKFTLIDVRDIGAFSACILTNLAKHANQAYELTANEKLTFSEMAKMLSSNLGVDIRFQSPNLINFFFTKKRQGTPTMFILVMIMLHFFPRFQMEPATTDCFKAITGKQPTNFEQFINDYKQQLIA